MGNRAYNHTLPETNIAPKKWAFPKGNSYSNHPFSGVMLVFGRVLIVGSSLHL